MAKPGENFVLRLLGGQAYVAHMKVLDVGVAGVADTVALVGWAYSATEGGPVHLAGFSVLRFDLRGALMWQVSRTLCSGAECGKFEIEGGLARTANGFIVAGQGLHVSGGRDAVLFAMRIDDAGAILWTHTYVPTVPTVPWTRIASIAPMHIPDHYLIAANNWGSADAWLFVIDGAGTVTNAALAPGISIRRLRTLPSQGICAVGDVENAAAGCVLNIDPVMFTPRWFRIYRTMHDAGATGTRWFDIAEGDSTLLVAGNFMADVTELWPVMAFIANDKAPAADVGKVRMAFRPVLPAEKPVRLRSVSSFIEDIIPVAPSGRKARFAVTGEADRQPWQFVLQEDATVEWQKRYRTRSGDTGTLARGAWPVFQFILAGGSVGTGSKSTAFLTSSPVTPMPATRDCSVPAEVTFKEETFHGNRGPYAFDTFGMAHVPGRLATGPDLKIEMACLDAQS